MFFATAALIATLVAIGEVTVVVQVDGSQSGVDFQRRAYRSSTNLAKVVVVQPDGSQSGVDFQRLGNCSSSNFAKVVLAQADGSQSGVKACGSGCRWSKLEQTRTPVPTTLNVERPARCGVLRVLLRPVVVCSHLVHEGAHSVTISYARSLVLKRKR